MYLELNYLYPGHPLFATPQAFWNAPFPLVVEMRDYARDQRLRELERSATALAYITGVQHGIKDWPQLNPWTNEIRVRDALNDGLTIETAEVLARLRRLGRVPTWVEADWQLIEGLGHG